MNEAVKDDSQALVLPAIPAKRYFTIGEVSDLCGVKAHVLRYWEREFSQLKPVKRRGNRRYYQHHEVLLVRRIRELLYEKKFTISGARNQLEGDTSLEPKAVKAGPERFLSAFEVAYLRQELLDIQRLLYLCQ